MAEFEVQIENSRGSLSHEPKTLRGGGENLILVGKHVVNIGVLPEASAIVLDPDDRLSMMSVTNEYNQVALLPDDHAPIVSLAVDEVVKITYQPNTYRGRSRHVFVKRNA